MKKSIEPRDFYEQIYNGIITDHILIKQKLQEYYDFYKNCLVENYRNIIILIKLYLLKLRGYCHSCKSYLIEHYIDIITLIGVILLKITEILSFL